MKKNKTIKICKDDNTKKCRNPTEWMDVLVLTNIQSFLFENKQEILSLRLLCKHITIISKQVNSIVTILLHFKDQVIPKVLLKSFLNKPFSQQIKNNNIIVTTYNDKKMLNSSSINGNKYFNKKEVNIDLINSYGMGFVKRLNGYLRHLLFLFYFNQMEIFLNEYLTIDFINNYKNIDLELLDNLLQHFEKRDIVKEFYNKWLTCFSKEKYLQNLNLIIKNNSIIILQKIFKENLIELIEYQYIKGNSLIYIQSIIKIKNIKNNYFILSLQYFEKSGKKDFVLTQLNFNYTKKISYLNLNFNDLTIMKREIFENSLLFKQCPTVTYQDFLNLLFIISNIDYNIILLKEKRNTYIALKESTEIPSFLKGSILIEDELLVKYFFNQFNGNSIDFLIAPIISNEVILRSESIWILQQKELILNLLEKVLSLCSKNNLDHKVELEEEEEEEEEYEEINNEEEETLKEIVSKRKKIIVTNDNDENTSSEEEEEEKKIVKKKRKTNLDKFLVDDDEEEENEKQEEEEEEYPFEQEEIDNEEEEFIFNDFNENYLNELFHIEILPLECYTLNFHTLKEQIYYQQFKIILEHLYTKERYLFYYKMKFNKYSSKESYYLTCHYKNLNNSNNNKKSDKRKLFFSSSSFVNNEVVDEKVKLNNCLFFYKKLTKYDLKIPFVTKNFIERVFNVVKKLVEKIEENHNFNNYVFGKNGIYLFENKEKWFTKILNDKLEETIIKYANFYGYGKPKFNY